MLRVAVLLILLSVYLPIHAADNGDEFLAAVKRAILAQDPDQLTALTYTRGLSATTIGHLKELRKQELEKTLFKLKPTKITVSFRSVDPNAPKFQIVNGVKTEPEFPIKGIVFIEIDSHTSYHQNGQNSETSARMTTSYPYTIVDGHYWFVLDRASH